jgi:WD40 repeat protein
MRTLAGFSQPYSVTAVAVTPDGSRAVSVVNFGILTVRDLCSGATEWTLEGHAGAITAVAVTPDGSRVVSASSDKTVKVWDLFSGRLLTTFATDFALQCCSASPVGRLLIAAGAGGRMHFLRLVVPSPAPNEGSRPVTP